MTLLLSIKLKDGNEISKCMWAYLLGNLSKRTYGSQHKDIKSPLSCNAHCPRSLILLNYFSSIGDRRRGEKGNSEEEQASVNRVICLGAWFDSLQLILFCILTILPSLLSFLQSSLRLCEFFFLSFSISLPDCPPISLLLLLLGFSPIPSLVNLSKSVSFFFFLNCILISWLLSAPQKNPEYI